jgi:RNA polymerase sigma-54 factor
VRAANDGSWAVELNAETLPRVLVDHIYFAQVSPHAKNQTRRIFWPNAAERQLADAQPRPAGEDHPQGRLEIVRRQDAFLVHGVRHLKPLNLHGGRCHRHARSTVSRVTANKYMLTPRGVFELRYFFTASIASSGGGDAHSSEAVRDRIKQLIEEEKPVDVLSDDAIVDMLRKNGVDIARRTVAKYREGMNIPSSVQRRREKRALASAGR